MSKESTRAGIIILCLALGYSLGLNFIYLRRIANYKMILLSIPLDGRTEGGLTTYGK